MPIDHPPTRPTPRISALATRPADPADPSTEGRTDATARDATTRRWSLDRAARLLLYVTVAVQAAYRLQIALTPHEARLDPVGSLLLAGVVIYALLGQRHRFAGVALRLTVSADFLISVADRFGLLGRPGTPGVYLG